MYVLVVLQTQPHEYCIKPEQYIYDFHEMEEQIKTWGVSKRDHLVFWSRSLLQDNFGLDDLIVADFHSDLLHEYPPPNGINSGVYHARVKRFFSK